MVDKNGCRLGDILEYSFNTIYVNKSRWFPVTIIRGILLYGIEGVRVLWALVVDIHYHVGNLSIKLIFIHVYLRNINFVELVIKIIFDPIFFKYHIDFQCIADMVCIPWMFRCENNTGTFSNVQLSALPNSHIHHVLVKIHWDETVSIMNLLFFAISLRKITDGHTKLTGL